MSSNKETSGDRNDRFAHLERDVAHIKEQIDSDRQFFIVSIKETRTQIHDKIDEIVRVQATVEHDVRDSIKETNRRLDTSNEVLNKINMKLTIHNFVFGAIALVVSWIGAAFFKSIFDHWISRF